MAAWLVLCWTYGGMNWDLLASLALIFTFLTTNYLCNQNKSTYNRCWQHQFERPLSVHWRRMRAVFICVLWIIFGSVFTKCLLATLFINKEWIWRTVVCACMLWAKHYWRVSQTMRVYLVCMYMLFVNKLSSTCLIWNEHGRDTNWRWRVGYGGTVRPE